MPEPIRVTVVFDSTGALKLRAGADALDAIQTKIGNLASKAGNTSRILAAAESDINRYASSLRYTLGSAVVYTNALFDGFYRMLSQFVRIGIYTAVAQIGILTSAIYKLGKEFLSVNEQFGELEVTLKSVYGSVTVARRIRDEIAAIASKSPLPISAVADTARSFAAIPFLSAQIGRQTLAGDTSASSFLRQATRLVEQMVTFRPDKLAQDATFAIREAITGQLRSLIRRFEFPSSLLSRASGQSLEQLKLDPQAMFRAIQKAFSQIITPSSVEDLAKQPKYLFQNIIEQIIKIPLLKIGRIGEESGKDFYNTFITFFYNTLNTATHFVGTQLKPISIKISDNLRSLFFTVVDQFDKVAETVLSNLGVGKLDLPGADRLERIFTLLQDSIEKANEYLPSFVDKMISFADRFIPLLKRIADVAISVVTTLAGIFEKSTLGGFATLYALRELPVIFRAISNILSEGFIRKLLEARLAAGAGFGLASTGALAGTGGLVAARNAANAQSNLFKAAALAASGYTPTVGASPFPLIGSTAFQNPSEARAAAFAAANPQVAAEMSKSTATLKNIQRLLEQGYNQSKLNPVLFTKPGVQGFTSALVGQPPAYSLARGPGLPIPPVVFAGSQEAALLQRRVLSNPLSGFRPKVASTVAAEEGGLVSKLLPAGIALGSLVTSIATTVIVSGALVLLARAAYKSYEDFEKGRAFIFSNQSQVAGFTPALDAINSERLDRASNLLYQLKQAQTERTNQGNAPFKEPLLSIGQGIVSGVASDVTARLEELASAGASNKKIEDTIFNAQRTTFEKIDSITLEAAVKRLVLIQKDLGAVSSALESKDNSVQVTLESSLNAAGKNITIGKKDFLNAQEALQKSFDSTYRSINAASIALSKPFPTIGLTKSLTTLEENRLTTLRQTLTDINSGPNGTGLLRENFASGLDELRAKIRNVREGAFTQLLEQLNTALASETVTANPYSSLQTVLKGTEGIQLKATLAEVHSSIANGFNQLVISDTDATKAQIDRNLTELDTFVKAHPDDVTIRNLRQGWIDLRQAVDQGGSDLVKKASEEVVAQYQGAQNRLAAVPLQLGAFNLFEELKNISDKSVAERAQVASRLSTEGKDLFEFVSPYLEGARKVRNFFDSAARAVRGLSDIELVPPELKPFVIKQNSDKIRQTFEGFKDALDFATEERARLNKIPVDQVMADFSSVYEELDKVSTILKLESVKVQTGFKEAFAALSGVSSRIIGLASIPGLSGQFRSGLVGRQFGEAQSLLNAAGLKGLNLPSQSLLGRSPFGNLRPGSLQLEQQKALVEFAKSGLASIQTNYELSSVEADKFKSIFEQIGASAEQAIAQMEGYGGSVRTFAEGFISVMDDFKVKSQNFTDIGKQIATSLSEISTPLVDIATGADKAGHAFQQFGYNLLRTAANALTNKLVQTLLGAIFGASGSTGGGLGSFYSGLFSTVTNAVSYRNNTVSTVPVSSPATGQINSGPVGSNDRVSNPQIAFDIVVNNGSVTAKQTSTKESTKAATNMAKGLQLAVQQELQRQMRQGGQLRQR